MFGAESYVVLKIYGASQTNISSHQAFGVRLWMWRNINYFKKEIYNFSFHSRMCRRIQAQAFLLVMYKCTLDACIYLTDDAQMCSVWVVIVQKN